MSVGPLIVYYRVCCVSKQPAIQAANGIGFFILQRLVLANPEFHLVAFSIFVVVFSSQFIDVLFTDTTGG